MVVVEIRPETPADIAAIRGINVAAFVGHPYSRQTEHLIVDALRDADALSLSLVAVSDGEPVGHVAFSQATVGDMGDGWYILGPIAVLPKRQGGGIGSLLVRAGLSDLRARAAAGCVLVGDPAFYGRFGFAAHPGLAYHGVPDEFVLGLAFGGEPPAGTIAAHLAFEVEPEA